MICFPPKTSCFSGFQWHLLFRSCFPVWSLPFPFSVCFVTVHHGHPLLLQLFWSPTPRSRVSSQDQATPCVSWQTEPVHAHKRCVSVCSFSVIIVTSGLQQCMKVCPSQWWYSHFINYVSTSLNWQVGWEQLLYLGIQHQSLAYVDHLTVKEESKNDHS